MEAVQVIRSQLKQCPFCAETIQAQAVKCRFCGEFLNTTKARALEAGANPALGVAESEKSQEKILYEGRPSLWGMMGTVFKGCIFLCLAAFLIYYPLEELTVFGLNEPSEAAAEAESVAEYEDTVDWSEVEPTSLSAEEKMLLFRKWREAGGAGLVIVVALALLLKMLRLKMTRYEVTAERFEWSRGIFDRRVDNLDMFRVVDLRLRRTVFDCIFGIGTVTLMTTDKTDPEFEFEKIRHSRRLYDVIKKASLDADRRSGVVHIE